MREGHSGVWVTAMLGFLATFAQFARLFSVLTGRLTMFDWTLLVVLMLGPLFVVRRYLGQLQDVTRDRLVTGQQIAVMGYLPLWIGLSLVQRVLGAP